MFALLCPVLAQSPIDIGWQGNLISLALMVYLGVNIWDKTLRNKPPAHDVYQTKEEADRLETRMRTEINALDTRSESRSKENRDLVQTKINDMERVLADKIADNKSNTNERFGKIDGQMSAFQSTMQGLSNDLMHQVGRIEGSISGVPGLPHKRRVA